MRISGIVCEPRTWIKLAPVVAFLTAMAIDARQLIPDAHLVRSAHAEGGEPLSEPAERERSFSERDVRGPYGFFFQGFVDLTLPGDSTLSVPVSAVGQLVADGMGGLPEGTRTLNFGGVILEQEAEGSYEVHPDGTGTATIEVTIVDQIGTPPPGLDIPSMTIETFSFVLTNRAAGIPFIGRNIVAADSQEPVGAVVLRGEAHRQHPF